VIQASAPATNRRTKKHGRLDTFADFRFLLYDISVLSGQMKLNGQGASHNRATRINAKVPRLQPDRGTEMNKDSSWRGA